VGSAAIGLVLALPLASALACREHSGPPHDGISVVVAPVTSAERVAYRDYPLLQFIETGLIQPQNRT